MTLGRNTFDVAGPDRYRRGNLPTVRLKPGPSGGAGASRIRRTTDSSSSATEITYDGAGNAVESRRVEPPSAAGPPPREVVDTWIYPAPQSAPPAE